MQWIVYVIILADTALQIFMLQRKIIAISFFKKKRASSIILSNIGWRTRLGSSKSTSPFSSLFTSPLLELRIAALSWLRGVERRALRGEGSDGWSADRWGSFRPQAAGVERWLSRTKHGLIHLTLFTAMELKTELKNPRRHLNIIRLLESFTRNAALCAV